MKGISKQSKQPPSGSQTVSVSHQRSVTAEYRSPLPPASELLDLAQVIPNVGERLMEMIEREQHHKQEMERRMVATDEMAVASLRDTATANATATRHRMLLGFLGAIACCGAGAWLAAIDKVTAAAGLFLASAAFLGGSLWSRRPTAHEPAKPEGS